MGIAQERNRGLGHARVVTGWRSHATGSVRADLWSRRDTVHTQAGTTFVDETAFRSFYDRTASALRSYLRMLTRDEALADDLLQESYFKFLRAGVSDLNEFEMKSYLYKTAGSVTRDYWRKVNRESRRLEGLAQTSPAGNPNLSPDIERLFKELDPRQQTLLWLAYVEGFQHSEIAQMLDLKEKSVRVLLFRARRQLAGMLSRDGLGPGEES